MTLKACDFIMQTITSAKYKRLYGIDSSSHTIDMTTMYLPCTIISILEKTKRYMIRSEDFFTTGILDDDQRYMTWQLCALTSGSNITQA